MSSMERNSFLTILLYMLLPFLVTVDKNLELAYPSYRYVLENVFEYFGCKLFTVIMHDFIGFSIDHYPFFQYIKDISTSLSFRLFAGNFS
jgi:hypothetical protein